MNPSQNKPFVVGVDGSDQARQAVRWAVRAATLREAPVLLTHALGVPDYYAGVLPPTPKVLDAVWARGNALLEEAADFAKSLGAVDVRTHIRDESPNVVLLEASVGAHALVIGAPEHSRIADMLVLGPLAPQLAAHARCPLVVVHGQQDEAAEGPVVVGVDGSELSERAISVAFDEAATRGAPLTAVHAWPGWYAEAILAEPLPDWPPLERIEQEILTDRLADWSKKYPSVTVRREVVQQSPGAALIESSKHAQLVVVGSRGRGGFGGLLLGSTSQKLIYHAASPVMVVRPDETGE
ncbi:universal stress protein [Thermocrispum municipale]|uniref:universal stress protein n=1 Tax=Thermocrispum municipale TaxID=37926 RepID=UPI0003F74D30|nr:universal stress protein [Thermocrispum municipale]